MGVETFVALVIYGASTYYSIKLQQKQLDDGGGPIKQRSHPPTYAERGSYAPHLTGRRRIGPNVVWVGDRKHNNVGLVETAVHVLCVGGDIFGITDIYVDGKPRFNGTAAAGSAAPILKSVTASGGQVTRTFIPGGRGTKVDVFWGEPNQPVNTFIGASNRVNVMSRWPHYCYVVLRDCDVPNGVWPSIEYEVEERYTSSGLVDTVEYLSGGGATLSTRTDNIFTVINGSAGNAKIRVHGTRLTRYPVGTKFRMVGNATPDADYTVASIRRVAVTTTTYDTIITPVEAIAGSNNAGTIAPYLDDANDGINPAHILWKQLFATYPQGLALDQAEFHMQSLEDLGTLLASEKVPGAVLIQNGEHLQTAIGNTLQDLGCFLMFDVRDGLYHFYPIRTSAHRAVINEDVELPSPPEISALHDVAQEDRVTYTFIDKNHRWREDTLSIGNDGHASRGGYASDQKAPLFIVNDYRTAQIVVERRSQENTGDVTAVEFLGNRESRILFPGEPISLYGVGQKLRVTEKTISVNEGSVRLRTIVDQYGTEVTPLKSVAAPEDVDPTEEEPDTAQGGAKLPPDAGTMGGTEGTGFSMTDEPAILLTRIRGENGTSARASIWLSRDDVTYVNIGSISTFHTGGLLQSWLLNTDPDEDAVGPDIEIVGPDFDDLIQDFSGDDDNWRVGRQVMIIDQEIMFLESVTVVDATHVTLNNILRAQLGSVKATHASGAIAYIMRAEDVICVRDPLAKTGTTIYWKMVPEDVYGTTVAIDDVPAQSLAL